MKAPLLSVVCNEPEGDIIRHVYPFIWTPENIERLVEQCLKFPTLYGHEIKEAKDVTNLFLDVTKDEIKAKGIFYIVDDFVGIFSITDFAYGFTDALAHYTFFDQRHKGRIPLVRAIMKKVFEDYHFNRLTVEVPLFTSSYTRHFVAECGFTLEGKRRKGIKFDNEFFDILLFGILKDEVINLGRSKN